MALSVERSASPLGPWTALKYAVSDGSVSIDRGDVRRTLSMTVVGWSSPQEALADLSPYATFVRVRRGIVLPGGDEMVDLGVFRIYDAKANLNSLEVTGFSQEVDLRDQRLTAPVTRASGTTGTISEEMELLIAAAIPDATLTFGPGTYDPNMGEVYVERDRLKALQDFAASAGGEFYATTSGASFAVTVPSTILDPPVWIVDAGPTGVLVSYTRSYTRGKVYNGVVVSNETSSSDPLVEPIRVLVVDLDQGSPTYWYGPFGQVPRFYTSGFIYTRAQAIAAGTSILSKESGLAAGLDFEAVPNPALDVDDVVQVVFSDRTSEIHVIDSVKIGLGASSTVSATTRVNTVEGD
jgi:hypothetical protein